MYRNNINNKKIQTPCLLFTLIRSAACHDPKRLAVYGSRVSCDRFLLLIDYFRTYPHIILRKFNSNPAKRGRAD